MALPAGFLEELRARTPLPALIGRKVKLARSGRQWKGCCPFHGEKSPSFYVYDDHFHCFGCGVHGDAISFVMQSQGAAFMEAVEILAREAGLEVPAQSPEAAQAEQKRHDLSDVAQQAGDFFASLLHMPEGARALAYLRGRGLSDATIRRFGLGWSGEGRGSLISALARENITQGQLLEIGLLRQADDDGTLRELFFNRVMFPIRDRRGRVISFGGRIMGDGQPKYVNGPETPLFSKRRNLYNLDLARTGVRNGAALVVVEGYMDVIALDQAGFAGAVAPLGTALTEEQMAELWRLSPTPILCFDGDNAGTRAAARAAELALPHLTPEQTLRIARMPAGEDPDSLVRTGAEAFQRVLEEARPLSDALFDLIREAAGDTTPEQRAGFRTRLEEAAGRIQHKALAGEYKSALLDKFFAARRRPARLQFGGTRPGGAKFGGNQKWQKFRRPGELADDLPEGMSRIAPDAAAAWAERSRNLVAILINHPGLLHDLEEAFWGIDLTPQHEVLRTAMMDWLALSEADHEPHVLDSSGLIAHLHLSGLANAAAQVLAATPYPLPEYARPEAMPAEAEAGWWHIFGLMHPDRLDAEIAEAGRMLVSGERPEEAQRRLILLCNAREAMRRGELEDDDTDGPAAERGPIGIEHD